MSVKLISIIANTNAGRGVEVARGKGGPCAGAAGGGRMGPAAAEGEGDESDHFASLMRNTRPKRTARVGGNRQTSRNNKRAEGATMAARGGAKTNGGMRRSKGKDQRAERANQQEQLCDKQEIQRC